MSSWIHFKGRTFEPRQVAHVIEHPQGRYALETIDGVIWASDGRPWRTEILPASDPQLRVLSAHLSKDGALISVNALVGWEVEYVLEGNSWVHSWTDPIVGDARGDDAVYGIWDTMTDVITVCGMADYDTRAAFEEAMNDMAAKKQRDPGVVPITKH